MMTRIRSIVLAVLAPRLAALLPLLVTVAAFAQDAAEVPSPELRRGIPLWQVYAIMAIFVVAVISVSLMPSKRGHQD